MLTVVWCFPLLGFGSPIALIGGFIFDKWIGTLLVVIGLSIGATFLYIFGNLPNKDKKKLNISFSVKKKIPIGVKRNKIKRRLRQIFNDGIKQNLIKLEKSVLVIAHATMLNNEYKIIKETLFKDFEKIN